MVHVDTPQSRCEFALAQGNITPPPDIYHRMWGAAKHDRATGIHRPLRASVVLLAPLVGVKNARCRNVTFKRHRRQRLAFCVAMVTQPCGSRAYVDIDRVLKIAGSHLFGTESHESLQPTEAEINFMNVTCKSQASACKKANLW